MKKYEELSEELKQEARRWQPDNYEKWTYKTQGTEIIFCAM